MTPDEVKRLATNACAAYAAVRNTTSNADRETLDKACVLLKQVHLEIDTLATQAAQPVADTQEKPE